MCVFLGKQQSWPLVITKGEGWDALYENQMQDLDVLQNVNDAIEWTNGLIRSINDPEDLYESI